MNPFLRFGIIFLSTYLLLLWFFPPQDPTELENRDNIEIVFEDSKITEGKLVSFTLRNNTDTPLSLGAGTPPEHILIKRYNNGEWNDISIHHEGNEVVLPEFSEKSFSYSAENEELFGQIGKYQVIVQHGEKEFFHDIEIVEPGFFSTIWRVLFWKPLYNGLIFLLEIFNGSLGLSIIVLTLIIKILLFSPTQKAMKSQRKMQKLQPELQKIRNQYKNDQQKIALESMNLWKKHNVNPFSAMVPMLIQFPILIALFYVIQNGLLPHNEFFLYSPIENFDFSTIQTLFLGIMPLDRSPFAVLSMAWLPIVVGLTQYVAMKLAFSRQKKNSEKNPSEKPTGFMGEFQEEFQKASKVFIYILPVMITIFTFTLPAAVGVYWFISTLFGISQQYVVNREVDEKK